MERAIANSHLMLGILALLVAPNSAHAQGASDSERAQALFDEARALMQGGKYPEACEKFAQSQALDPGGGTILNLGMCRKREGRTGTAFKVLTDALSRARADGRSDRTTTAERELAELAPTLSRLTVQLAAGAAAPDLLVELDGAPLDPNSFGQSLPLDPGVHRLEVSRPGYQPWTSQITVGPVADLQAVTVPPLSPVTPAPIPVAIAPSATSPAPAPKSSPASELPRSEGSSSKVLGFALVSTGSVALAAGGYFGIRALSSKASSNEHWNGTSCTAPSCVDDWNDAKGAAHLSTIGIGIGIAAIGAGAYFLLRPTHGSNSSVALSVGMSGANPHAVAIGHF